MGGVVEPGSKYERLCDEIALPGEGFIVMFSSKTKKMKKGAKAVPKSRIYVRPAC